MSRIENKNKVSNFLSHKEKNWLDRHHSEVSSLQGEELNQILKLQTIELIKKNEDLEQNIKELKHKLVARNAKLNAIYNTAVEGIITINAQGIIESLNHAVTQIFCYQENELVGENVTKLLHFPHKELNNIFLNNYIALSNFNDTNKVRLVEGRRNDDSIIPLDVSLSEYYINDSLYYTAVIRDVSERVQREKMDKIHLDELAHVTRVGLMGEMTSGIAHEINQPLTAISTYSLVCLRMIENDTLDLNILKETLRKTEKQAVRAGQIVSRMRAFISSKSSRRSTVNINHLVNNVMTLSCDESRKYSIRCSFSLATSLPCISADSIQIEQVLLNLIKNSIDVLAKIPKSKKRRLSIHTYLQEANEKQYIVIRVKDNGTGIKEKDQTNIFTPFYTTKESGMGMGLSICKSLVLAHQGELRFNTSTKGTTFYINLPMIEASHDS